MYTPVAVSPNTLNSIRSPESGHTSSRMQHCRHWRFIGLRGFSQSNDMTGNSSVPGIVWAFSRPGRNNIQESNRNNFQGIEWLKRYTPTQCVQFAVRQRSSYFLLARYQFVKSATPATFGWPPCLQTNFRWSPLVVWSCSVKVAGRQLTSVLLVQRRNWGRFVPPVTALEWDDKFTDQTVHTEIDAIS